MLEPGHDSLGETAVLFSRILEASCFRIEIGHDGNIYTIEINKCYKSGLFTFPPENQLSVTSQVLVVSIEKVLLEVCPYF